MASMISQMGKSHVFASPGSRRQTLPCIVKSTASREKGRRPSRSDVWTGEESVFQPCAIRWPGRLSPVPNKWPVQEPDATPSRVPVARRQR